MSGIPDLAQESHVLLLKGKHGVALRNSFGSSLIDPAFESSCVDVAQTKYFLLRQAFVYQLLFHLNHIVVRNRSQEPCELGPHSLRSFALMQLQDHMF